MNAVRLPPFPFDFSKLKSNDPETNRVIVVFAVVIVAFMIICSAVAFSLALQGAEKTMVPDVRGQDLAQALLELQEKELYPRIALRNSDDVNDRGRVLEQKPAAGTIVKAGRRVSLTVSRGAVIDKVENFVGQDVNEVKIHLQALFSNSARPLLSIKEPPVYIFDAKPAGVILQQKPQPDTPLSQPVKLELVISRGPEKSKATVPALKGLGMNDALSTIASSGVMFSFTSRKPDKGEKPLTIGSQMPGAGTQIAQSAKVALVITEPSSAGSDGKIFGIMKQTLPEYPYPIKVTVEALGADDKRATLFESAVSGGEFTLPWYQAPGTVLILSILGQEKYRFEVK